MNMQQDALWMTGIDILCSSADRIQAGLIWTMWRPWYSSQLDLFLV